jgi:DNA invertase Pin-like site-specific DNA recombinase
MRAIVYSRVSTDAQERDGTSLDTQERASQDPAPSWRLMRILSPIHLGRAL